MNEEYPLDVPDDAPGYSFFKPVPWSDELEERIQAIKDRLEEQKNDQR